MSRLDARCKVDLPVSVLVSTNGSKAKEKRAKFSEISLTGGFIDLKQPAFNKKTVGLRYELPKHGEFEVIGNVVRKDKTGIATRFHNISRDARIRLWDFIKDNLEPDSSCPYCGVESAKKMISCASCGWNLNFHSPDYLALHEKESFISRLTAKSRDFSLEDLYKILNYIDVEILGIGKSMEINEEIVGSSRSMLEAFSMIRKFAPTDSSVLINGESGTGKELVAMAIHERSSRRAGPFVPINCGAMPENVLEAELFGYEKGAVPGTSGDKSGKIEYANGGTIFLDEIEKLSDTAQSKILRLLQEKVVERIGSKEAKKVDVRLIAASSADLKAAVSREAFRKDLFYGLEAFTINIPPVRDRGDDKIILARYFLNKFSREINVTKTFSKETVDTIKNYDWPGNVRDIINRTRRAVVMSSNSVVESSDLDLNLKSMDIASIASLREVKQVLEKQKLIEALNICNNNISKTAKVLGISRPSVYSLKKKFRI